MVLFSGQYTQPVLPNSFFILSSLMLLHFIKVTAWRYSLFLMCQPSCLMAYGIFVNPRPLFWKISLKQLDIHPCPADSRGFATSAPLQ
ncbi:hypothetical protein ACHAXS_000195 [Conticribra weissflogii]